MQAVTHRKTVIDSIVESVFDRHAANFWLQKLNPLWSVNQSLGKIVSKQVNGADTVSLTIQTNKNFKKAQAGQHHPVIIQSNGRLYERTYSLTQVDDQHVLLTAKKVADGVVSNWLVNDSKVGDMIEFGLPYGDMTIQADAQPLILLAAGSGITPMYSLLKDLLKTDSNRSVILMYWVKTQADVAFKAELEQWAQQHKNFELKLFYTQAEHADERINKQHAAQIEHLATATVYACGPSGFVHSTEEVFAQAATFKSEAFSLTPIISDEVGFINVTLTQSQKTISIPKGQSILVSLEQQNIKPTHGCRMGICNKCACNKAQGSTKNLVNGAENNEPGNLLKICVNSAQTDLIIDL